MLKLIANGTFKRSQCIQKILWGWFRCERCFDDDDPHDFKVTLAKVAPRSELSAETGD